MWFKFLSFLLPTQTIGLNLDLVPYEALPPFRRHTFPSPHTLQLKLPALPPNQYHNQLECTFLGIFTNYGRI